MQKQGIIFGGSFNPPHTGHTQASEYVVSQGYADKLIVVPVGLHAFDKKIVPAHQRLAMVKLAFADLIQKYPDQVSISEYELDHPGISHSYHTLLHFAQQYPEYRWKWLIGADNVAKFDQWTYVEELLAFGVVVFPRPGVNITKLPAGMELLSAAEPVDMSSTAARHAFTQARVLGTPIPRDVKVPAAVREYIETHAVY